MLMVEHGLGLNGRWSPANERAHSDSCATRERGVKVRSLTVGEWVYTSMPKSFWYMLVLQMAG